MRLNPNAGARHLTLARDVPAPITGIAEAVALAAARGPAMLPPGIADVVLRLAFGRGALLPAVESANESSMLLDPGARRALRVVHTPRPVVRREKRQPREAPSQHPSVNAGMMKLVSRTLEQD